MQEKATAGQRHGERERERGMQADRYVGSRAETWRERERGMQADRYVGSRAETDYRDRGCAIWFARERDKHAGRQGERGMQVDRHVGR